MSTVLERVWEKAEAKLAEASMPTLESNLEATRL